MLDAGLMLLSFGTLVAFLKANSEGQSLARSIFVGLLVAISALLGARVVHVLVEKPDLLEHPGLLFSNFDGMTFNGSLLFGLMTLALSKPFFPRNKRDILTDILALWAALTYGILRIGCFFKGCCWGSITDVPWAVHYSSSTHMPWLGLPVHPVQLYDSSLGFGIALLLASLHKKKQFTGHHLSVMLALYSVGRFITEFFRGDDFRGAHLLFDLSVSQWISIGILIALSLHYVSRTRFFWACLSLSFLTGCLPLPPKTVPYVLDGIEHYRSPNTSQSRTLIFIAADETIQQRFSTQLMKLYRRPVRIEDVAFWQYYRDIKNNYSAVLRLPPENVSAAGFDRSIALAESLGNPYDILFLTHGFPNHLSSGEDYFLSFREISQLHLKHLELVMMQSCFGRTLAQDWLNAGATAVISFDGFNRNFFFFGSFFKAFSQTPDIEAAFQLARQRYTQDLNAEIYRRALKETKLTHAQQNLPWLDTRSTQRP